MKLLKRRIVVAAASIAMVFTMFLLLGAGSAYAEVEPEELNVGSGISVTLESGTLNFEIPGNNNKSYFLKPPTQQALNKWNQFKKEINEEDPMQGDVDGIFIGEGINGISESFFEGLETPFYVLLPRSMSATYKSGVKGIHKNAFRGCTNISQLFYGGSAAQWEKLKAGIQSGNDIITNLTPQNRGDYENVSVFRIDPIGTLTYNGKYRKPKPDVYHNDALYWAEMGCFFKWSNNKNVGKAKLTLTGKNYFIGTRSMTFKIVPKRAVIKTITAGKRKLTVKMSTKVASTGGKYYQIQYRQKGKTSWKSINTSSREKTIKSLKKGKRYQVRVRAYKKVSGVKYIGKWSAIRSKVSK